MTVMSLMTENVHQSIAVRFKLQLLLNLFFESKQVEYSLCVTSSAEGEWDLEFIIPTAASVTECLFLSEERTNLEYIF